MLMLNGCIQSSFSFLGPTYTVASTGNIYQAGLSLTVNQTFIHMTGKSPIEHAKDAFKDFQYYESISDLSKQISFIP